MVADTVVLRTSWRTRLVRLAPVAVCFAFLWVLGLLTLDNLGVFVAVGFVVGALLGLAISARQKVVLTPDRLTVVGWRRWDVPWSQVQGVSPAAFGWFRRRSVAVQVGRMPRSLFMLTVSWPWERARVQTQYQQIGQWWLDHRGADWRPMPLPTTGAGNVVNPYAAPPGA